MDQISDEYSSYYLNHSEFPVSSSYKLFEENLLKSTDFIIKNSLGKQNKMNLIRSIRELEFMDLKLINKTQKNFNSIFIDNILIQSENDLILCFDEFLIKNKLLDRNSNIFNKIVEINDEDRNRKLFLIIYYLKEYNYAYIKIY